ncbi:uncharacterized protein CEXT_573101 [Caerostris extrusa]|uniref:Ig-like domain-containing protein n=1 Tax=Caerostris extrusa TaxID=172846 RepID=A0AAV4WMQ2_CAEEX|nr:uncharacterized protein CEXT_573101 [Caerostris extrusa]
MSSKAFTCYFSSLGEPSPAVKWWRDAELLDDSYYITPQGFARNELLLSSLKRADLMTSLTCQVSNSNLSAPVTSTVIIDMNRECKTLSL